MDTPFIGTIILFAGVFAPRDWAFCDGSIIPISQNQALFSVIGTTYGGNGTSNFALPDLRSRVPLGMGQGPGLTLYRAGDNGGAEGVALLTTQAPPHTHTIAVSSVSTGNTSSPTNAFLSAGTTTVKQYNSQANGAILNPEAVNMSGGGQAHENRQPYLAMNYIIALQGLFPPRY